MPHAKEQPAKYSVTHNIITTEPPVSARFCRLHSECPKATKQKFEHMLQQGTYYLSF